jgi:hypothetical protein
VVDGLRPIARVLAAGAVGTRRRVSRLKGFVVERISAVKALKRWTTNLKNHFALIISTRRRYREDRYLTGGGDVRAEPLDQSRGNRAVDAGHEVVGIRRGWGGLLMVNRDTRTIEGIIP